MLRFAKTLSLRCFECFAHFEFVHVINITGGTLITNLIWWGIVCVRKKRWASSFGTKPIPIFGLRPIFPIGVTCKNRCLKIRRRRLNWQSNAPTIFMQGWDIGRGRRCLIRDRSLVGALLIGKLKTYESRPKSHPTPTGHARTAGHSTHSRANCSIHFFHVALRQEAQLEL